MNGERSSIEVSRPPTWPAFISAVREPQIVLAALTRLRWLAVVGQIAATWVAIGVLRLQLPIAPIAGVIVLTAASNALLMWLPTVRKPREGLVEATLLLDVLLLTALLYLTGGSSNPFATFYLIHVTIAVIVLRVAWTWAVVGAVAACYGLLLERHDPLGAPGLSHAARAAGDWMALVMVAVLIATFIGGVIRSLRQREGELAAAHARAARNEQLAALTTLAAGAAHELNTPLGTIAVVARELELARDADHAEDARLIRREVDRCRNILSRMRFDLDEDGSRRGSVRLDELERALRESLNEQELSRLQLWRPPDLEQVSAPALALEQALLVLLRNAFDASATDKPVALTVRAREGRVRFEVRDRGCGMSPEQLRRAGEPFFTTKEPGEGTGLGLFLVRHVAEQCGATFTMDSQLGVGTTCVLELPPPDARIPAAPPAPAAAMLRPAAAAAPTGRVGGQG